MLFEKVLRWLAIRPRSRAEVRQYLKKSVGKETAGHRIEEVLAALTTRHFIDDRAFARWLVTSRLRRAPRGPKLLRAELLAKGVSRDIVEEVMGELPHDAARQLELAGAALEKRPDASLETPQEQQRAAAYLARRGFSWEVIRTVIDRARRKTVQ